MRIQVIGVKTHATLQRWRARYYLNMSEMWLREGNLTNSLHNLRASIEAQRERWTDA